MKRIPVARDYQQTLKTISARIEQSRHETLRTVNRTLVDLYWFIGRIVTERQERSGWGDAVVERLARDLRARFPDMRGLSVQNVWRMRQFHLAYRDDQNLSALLREVSWTNHLLILGHAESGTEREFYLRMNIREGWSSRQLERQLHSGLYERFALAAPTGKTGKVLAALPEAKTSLDAHFKDEYALEFLGLSEAHSERELRKAILANLRDFFLEFGRHFAFIGEEYPIVIGGEEYHVDLLFYHRLLQCLVAVDLKAGKFLPEYVGKMQFYLAALDEKVKLEHERPSAGLILCKSKNQEVVRLALARSLAPTRVAAYRTQLPDERLIKQRLRALPLPSGL
ncbi:MAG: DUF1016 domain-containing protein [Planctomycetes bacterium]|nr:DUF1016 domain-containing protein [Planctomycetota bacterium]